MSKSFNPKFSALAASGNILQFANSTTLEYHYFFKAERTDTLHIQNINAHIPYMYILELEWWTRE